MSYTYLLVFFAAAAAFPSAFNFASRNIAFANVSDCTIFLARLEMDTHFQVTKNQFIN